MLVASCAALVTFVYIDLTDAYQLGGDKYLNHQWFTVLLTFILAWMTSKITLGVYGIVIDALLMCILADDNIEAGAKKAGKTYSRTESKRTMFKFKDSDFEEEEAPSLTSGAKGGAASKLHAQL